MTDFKELNLKLCMSSVFRSVTEKPLFKYLSEYARCEGREEKVLAFAAFVSEIYKNGGSLSELVARLVFEDENVYIKSVAHDKSVRREISIAAKPISL